MKLRYRLLAALLVLIVVVVSIPLGCGSSTPALKIASVVPTSGTMAGRFGQVTSSLRYLAQQINDGTHEYSADGGGIEVNGQVYDIAIIEEDADSTKIYNTFLKLTTEDEVLACFGSASAAGVLAVQQIMETAGLIYISYAGAADEATMTYNGLPVQYFFRMVSLDQYSMGPKYNGAFVEAQEGVPGPFAHLKDDDGKIKVYRVETQDAAGTARDQAARDWATANPSSGVEIVGTQYLDMGITSYSPTVQAAINLGAEVIDTGAMRDADMVNFLKELHSKSWGGDKDADGKFDECVFQTSGGGASDSSLHSTFAGDLTKYNFVYSLYHPGSLEEADDNYKAWVEQQEESLPQWMQDVYDYALSKATAPGDEQINDQLGFAKCYSVGQAIVHAIRESGVTTFSKENSLALRDVIAGELMYDMFGPLHWTGEETYGRNCCLTYNWHMGQKGGRTIVSPNTQKVESEPTWVFAIQVEIP